MVKVLKGSVHPDSGDVEYPTLAALESAYQIEIEIEPKMPGGATAEQLDTIEAQRIDDTARAMSVNGVALTWEQAERIGDTGAQWLRDRLGLTRTTTDRGVQWAP